MAMNAIHHVSLVALLGALSFGCNAPAPPSNTGGTDAGNVGDACGRGLVVVQSDYVSTNVSLVSLAGKVLSSSLISSASTKTGLSASLSGDVVVPSMPQNGSSLVVIDQYPVGVVSWVDVATGSVLGQLNVGSSPDADAQSTFSGNPHDYVEVRPNVAYVSRYDPNPNAGQAPFDGGSDIILLDVADKAHPTITGRIDLSSALTGEDPTFYPRPGRMVVDGDRVLALLSADNLGFDASASSRLVVIDPKTDQIVSVKVLDGLHTCMGLALAPSGGRVSVTCAGTFELATMASNIDESALVVLSRNGDTLTEEKRILATAMGTQPFGFTTTFADADTVLATTTGTMGADGVPGTPDHALAIHVSTGARQDLAEAPALNIGEVRCAAACGVCFIASSDPAASVLKRFTVSEGKLTADQGITVDTSIGLPPKYVGQF